MGGQSNPGGASARRSGRGADGGTRTPTGRSPPGPKPGAYSNSATSARRDRLWRPGGGWGPTLPFGGGFRPTPGAGATGPPPGAEVRWGGGRAPKTQGP